MVKEQGKIKVEQVGGAERNFDWLQIKEGGVKEKSGVRLREGTIDLDPASEAIRNILNPEELERLGKYRSPKLKYWVPEGIDVKSALSDSERKILMCGAGLVAPVSQFVLRDDVSIIGDTFVGMGEERDKLIAIGVGLPGFDLMTMKDDKAISDDEMSADNASWLTFIAGKVLDVNSQELEYCGHSSHAEEAIKNLSGLCSVMALEPPLSLGKDPVFTEIQGLNVARDLADNPLTGKIADTITMAYIRAKAGLNLGQGERDGIYVASANELAKLHGIQIGFNRVAYTRKSSELAKADGVVKNKLRSVFPMDVLMGTDDKLTPRASAIGWIEANFEQVGGKSPVEAMEAWLGGQMPEEIGHDTPLIRADVIKLISSQIVERFKGMHDLPLVQWRSVDFAKVVAGEVRVDPEQAQAAEMPRLDHDEQTKLEKYLALQHWSDLVERGIDPESVGRHELPVLRDQLDTLERMKQVVSTIASGRVKTYDDFSAQLNVLFAGHPYYQMIQEEMGLPEDFTKVGHKYGLAETLHRILFEHSSYDLHLQIDKIKDGNVSYAAYDNLQTILLQYTLYWQIRDGGGSISEVMTEEVEKCFQNLTGSNGKQMFAKLEETIMDELLQKMG